MGELLWLHSPNQFDHQPISKAENIVEIVYMTLFYHFQWFSKQISQLTHMLYTFYTMNQNFKTTRKIYDGHWIYWYIIVHRPQNIKLENNGIEKKVIIIIIMKSRMYIMSLSNSLYLLLLYLYVGYYNLVGNRKSNLFQVY